MGIRTAEEQTIMIMACMKTRGIEESKMAKFLKMDVSTFEKKILNNELNLREVITFSDHCRLDTKQIFELFFPNFNGRRKEKEKMKNEKRTKISTYHFRIN